MKYIIIFTLLFGSNLGLAQDSNDIESKRAEDKILIEHAIESLFNGMRDGDSSKVAKLFHDEVRLMSTFTTKSGESKMITGNISEFLTAIGTPHDEIWDERISALEIKVDDNLAQAWMNYSFYVGDSFSHCGINAFQFVRLDEKWQIIQLIDTRRKKDCN